MNWALTLTHHDRQQAEDLVHDTFIHFMISRPDLAVVESEGYFYVMLRNMHVSQMRRALRVRETAYPIADILSISETTSVQAELRNAGQRLQLQDELCRICQYASIRKNKSKIGSAVILRFFHGYYPKEIAAVTRSSRAGVDKMLQRARTEARLYLQDPDSLSFLHGEQAPADLQIRFGQGPEDFLSDLRSALYLSRAGSCLATEELTDAYQQKDSERVTPEMLAHIVCCGRCLDEVNRLLGLPLLASREPEQMSGRDKSDHDKSGRGAGGSGATGDFMEKPRRRLKQVLEHRPKELRVSVNGFILASHAINSELNKLSISAKGEDKIGFVEVFSEDEVRLLFCLVDTPPDGPVEQRAKADLADDRTLELSLDFSDSWPSLDVTYHDPHFQVSESAANTSALDTGHILADDVEGSAQEVEKIASDHKPLSGGPPRFFGRLASIIRSSLTMGMFARPAAVTATLAILLVAALILIRFNRVPQPSLSAADLLQRSTAAEDAIAGRTDQVLHRTMSLEIRSLVLGPQASSPASSDSRPLGSKQGRTPVDPAPPGLIAQQRIEIWQSGEKGITARRLYDGKGQLIAGDWRRSDGVQTLYHHGSKPRVQVGNADKSGLIANPEDVWQLSPSAKEFVSLVGSTETTQLQEQSNAYVIDYERKAKNGAGLVRATLLLSRDDLHATELTIVVEANDNQQLSDDAQNINRQWREYHFVETSYERRPTAAVAPVVFDPERELLGATATRGHAESLAGSPTLPAVLSPSIATPELEVEAWRLLNEAGADTGEQITVTRTSEGRLKIDGLVDTETRKAELLRALAPIARQSSVHINILTVGEAVAREQGRSKSRDLKSDEVTVQRLETSSEEFPAKQELRRHFGSDEEARRFAAQMINRSRRAMSHAAALKRLVSQFSLSELHTLAPEARTKWLTLIRTHARAFQQETTGLRQELSPIFFSGGGLGNVSGPNINDDSELVRVVFKLFDIGAANDRSVRSAFSVSTEVSVSPVGVPPELQSSLKRAEELATLIQAVN
jgi:DNA-directed RNA polymerase specialized sigma24 family protein